MFFIVADPVHWAHIIIYGACMNMSQVKILLESHEFLDWITDLEDYFDLYCMSNQMQVCFIKTKLRLRFHVVERHVRWDDSLWASSYCQLGGDEATKGEVSAAILQIALQLQHSNGYDLPSFKKVPSSRVCWTPPQTGWFSAFDLEYQWKWREGERNSGSERGGGVMERKASSGLSRPLKARF